MREESAIVGYLEAQVASLKRTNRALLLIAVTAYVLGVYVGFIIAMQRFDAL